MGFMKFASISFIFLIFQSCITLGTLDSGPPQPAGNLDPLRTKVLQAAQDLQGNRPEAQVTVKGKSFTLDCIGTVSAAYWGAGVDIRKDFGRYEGNGVSRLYQSLDNRRILARHTKPQEGDLIFWENTWDRNNDGIVGNDGPTHAGLVMKVDQDGTIHYLHEDYLKGVVVAVMNLNRPGVYKDELGKTLNTPLYMGSYPGNPKNPPKFLSGDLWVGFGGVSEVAKILGISGL